MGKSILTRAISGAVYVAAIVLCIIGGTFWIQSLSCLFGLLACLELTHITVGFPKYRRWALACDVALMLVLAYGPSLALAPVVIGLFLLRLVSELAIKSGDHIKSLGLSLSMFVYLGLPCFLMSAVGKADEKMVQPFSQYPVSNVLLAMFILIWVNDTGAYLVGSSLGRHRLCERLSPKKSIEGFVGGLALSIAVALAFCFLCPGYFGLPGNWMVWAGFAVITTLFSTWGDLLESCVKRTLGIKDSGNIIPGHGGILDRIDSFLMVMPATAVFLYYVWFS